MQYNTSDNTNAKNGSTEDLHSLAFIVQSAGLGTWDIRLNDGGTPEIHCNDRCRELLRLPCKTGIDCEAAIQSIHTADRDNVLKMVHQALNRFNDGLVDIVCRTSGNSRELFWLRFKGKGHWDETGRPCRFSGIVLDLSDKVLVQSKATFQESLVLRAVSEIGIGLFTIYLADNHMEHSPAFAQIITGDATETLTRERVFDFIHPDHLETNRAASAAAGISGRLFLEYITVWKDGSAHWVRTMGKYVYDRQGRPQILNGTVEDITEQQLKEQALKASDERLLEVNRKNEVLFRNITSNSPAGLCLSDKTGQLTYVNKTLTSLTGMSNESLLGKGLWDVVIAEDRINARQAFEQATASLGNYDMQFRIRQAGGNVVWCRGVGNPYYSEDGSYGGYVFFCMNIHERVVATNELRLSEIRIRKIIEQAPLAICLLKTRDMVVETANETFLQMVGRGGKPIMGLTFADALPELLTQEFNDLLGRVYDSGVPYYGYGAPASLEHHRSGENHYYDFSYTPVRDTDGQVSGVMIIANEVTAQVNSRKAIEESEARYQELIKEAPYAMSVFTGRDMIIEIANEAMLRVWGKDDRIKGMPFHLALPEMEGQPFLKLLDDVYMTGIPYHSSNAKADLEVNGKLSSFYFNFNYQPLKNAQGETYGILTMAVDITEQVLATRKLEESELFARSVIQNSPVATSVFEGEDLVIKIVNNNMLALMGRDASITGQPLFRVMPELLALPMAGELKKVYTTGETYLQPEEKVEFIHYGQRHTGYYSYIYKALFNTAGKIYGAIGTAIDLTSMVLTRQKIEEAEASLRSAIELAELGTWEVDLETNNVHFSARHRSWFGYDEAEVITMKMMFSTMNHTSRKRFIASSGDAINPVLRSNFETEFTITNKKTGKEHIIHSQGKAFFTEKGVAYRLSGTARDITVQRKAQLALEQEVKKRTEELNASNTELYASNERLQHSNEELEQYAYVTSHDLQEPLRKIRTYSGMLEKKVTLTAEARPLLNKIMSSAERMSLLIQDLLEFSRLLKSETPARVIALSEICRAVTDDFELNIREKNAVVRIGSLPEIEAIGLQMNQLFYNLVSNALKFSRPGIPPVIDISSRTLGANEVKQFIPRPCKDCIYYQVTFTDNGIGFDAVYAEQIFEVFKRLHGREHYPGTGIGLALCRRIVNNHYGHLYAVSEPNAGTSFHIILPDKNTRD